MNRGGTYREEISRICQFTLDNFQSAVESGLIVHDSTEINAFRFRASINGLNRFKKAHRIVKKRINLKIQFTLVSMIHAEHIVRLKTALILLLFGVHGAKNHYV